MQGDLRVGVEGDAAEPSDPEGRGVRRALAENDSMGARAERCAGAFHGLAVCIQDADFEARVFGEPNFEVTLLSGCRRLEPRGLEAVGTDR